MASNKQLEFREWGEFLSDFERPSSVEDIQNKVKRNLSHYQANYLGCAGLLFALYGLASPPFGLTLLFVIAAGAGLWFFVQEGQVVAGQSITRLHKTGFIFLIALLALYFSDTGMSFLLALLLSFLFSLVHASYKGKPSIIDQVASGVKKVEQILEDAKKLR